MKKQPYREYIDFKKEQKEYVNLCNGKSKLYTLYSDWEEHITECVAQITNEKDLYNLKRYCMNRERLDAKSPEMFVAYVVLVFSILIDKLTSELSLWGGLVVVIFGIWYVIWNNKQVVKESCFYRDIIEIIDKIEKTKKKD